MSIIPNCSGTVAFSMIFAFKFQHQNFGHDDRLKSPLLSAQYWADQQGTFGWTDLQQEAGCQLPMVRFSTSKASVWTYDWIGNMFGYDWMNFRYDGIWYILNMIVRRICIWSRQDVPEENFGDWNILEDDDNDALQGLLLPLVNVNVLPDNWWMYLSSISIYLTVTI